MRRVGWLVGAIAVLGLGLTACGDDAGSTTPTTAGDTSTTPTTELAVTTEPSTSTTAPAATDTLYFAKEGRVFTVVPGGSPTAVTDGPRDDQPAPSPNGEQIAFVRLDDVERHGWRALDRGRRRQQRAAARADRHLAGSGVVRR